MQEMKTGFFAVPGSGYRTKVHIVYAIDTEPLCSAHPRNDAEFQWCSGTVHLDYVECKRCKARYAKLLENESAKATVGKELPKS